MISVCRRPLPTVAFRGLVSHRSIGSRLWGQRNRLRVGWVAGTVQVLALPVVVDFGPGRTWMLRVGRFASWF